MNQHEITERRPLLDASGNLTEPGYAKSLLPVYRRSDIQANKLRIKEWDYYCINNGHFALALTIADNSYMGLDSISLLNLDEGWEITKSPMKAFTNGRVGLPESSERGDVHSAGRNYSILFKNEGDQRVLIAQMKTSAPRARCTRRSRSRTSRLSPWSSQRRLTRTSTSTTTRRSTACAPRAP